MWIYSVFLAPLLGLLLFFVLQFDMALALYLVFVLSFFAIYYYVSERRHSSS